MPDAPTPARPFDGALLLEGLDPVRYAIAERDQGRCRRCSSLATPPGVMRIAEGGYTLRNLVTCCRRCDRKAVLQKSRQV